jgi:hypothetical protein
MNVCITCKITPNVVPIEIQNSYYYYYYYYYTVCLRSICRLYDRRFVGAGGLPWWSPIQVLASF